KVYREAQWEWFTSTFLTRIEKDGGILITNTRWHEDDLCGRLLKLAASDPEADQWVVLNLPAICEEISDEDQRDIGEALWPDKYPLERLNKIKAANIRVWNALFQQRPSAQEGNILKREWWKFYDELPPKFEKVIQTWDMSFKEGNDNSFVVCLVMAKIGPRHLIVNRPVKRQMGFSKTLDAFMSVQQAYSQSRDKFIEDKANGPGIIDMVKKKVSGVIPVDPAEIGSKVERAEAVSWLVEAGNVELPNPEKNPWVWDFIDECASFPNGAHDDQVDAFTQGLSKLANLQSSTERLKALLAM
ncbi:MAG TPA: phage terminase large subunit, partial [bacterium]|nr:phage terminase large subunit [bacterium]